MLSFVVQVLLLYGHFRLSNATPSIPGVKATFSNPKNNSQTFVALLSRPQVLTYNNYYQTDNRAWNCDLSKRNCYHWDELHDWGTFNITVTLEGYLSHSWTLFKSYQTALYLLPGSCAQVYVYGKLVQDSCGYPQFATGYNASQFDWDELKNATDNLEGDDQTRIPIPTVVNNVMRTLNWV
jgi:hypothetical protein